MSDNKKTDDRYEEVKKIQDIAKMELHELYLEIFNRACVMMQKQMNVKTQYMDSNVKIVTTRRYQGAFLTINT